MRGVRGRIICMCMCSTRNPRPKNFWEGKGREGIVKWLG